MKRLYRIGVFLIVSIVIGVLVLYFLDKFAQTVRDTGRKPQVNGTEEDLPQFEIPLEIMPSPGRFPEIAGSAEVFSGEDRLKKAASYATEAYDGNTGKSHSLTPVPTPDPERYYLAEVNGYVIVYYEDTDEFFCDTGIALEDLPLRLREEIREKKTIRTQEELYAFLESYSS